MSIDEKEDLIEYTKKEMSIEHEEKLVLLGVMKGIQLGKIISRDATEQSAAIKNSTENIQTLNTKTKTLIEGQMALIAVAD